MAKSRDITWCERLGLMADVGRFWLLAGVLVVSPWLFGAWEWWTFTLFLIVIALVALLGGLSVVMHAPPVAIADWVRSPHIIWVSALPFLVYAAVRTVQAPVPMDALKLLLIHISAWVVGISVAFGMRYQRQLWLWRLIMINGVILGLYGIVNHMVTGSTKVLWADGYPQYYELGRLGGTYFCPSHFSGVMELLLCMGLAGIVSYAVRRRWVYVLLGLFAMGMIIATKTRGGGLTALVVLFALMVWGLGERRPLSRWSWRALMLSLTILLLMAFTHIDTPFRQRFIDYFDLGRSGHTVSAQIHLTVHERLPQTSRGRMFAGAWRAWRTAPWFGIGMGQHSAYWPFFAATDDGDREAGIWPTMTNEDFHSYEVHNDWLQLGEELGIIGLILFLVPFVLVMHVLFRDRRRLCRGSPYLQRETGDPRHVQVLAGLLVVVAMAFHSLGDFNLQMPATSWLVSALVGIPIGMCRQPSRAGRK